MVENLREIPSLWRESFGYFGDETLHLLAKLYLSDRSVHKTHSRELLIEGLWNYANRSEFNQASLHALSSLDTNLLLLLFLGLDNIQDLGKSLPEYSYIEICLQLLHLQERLLVLCIGGKHSRKPTGSSTHLIPKIEKQLQGPEGAYFVIAPQFSEPLQKHLDFRTLFHGIPLDAPLPPSPLLLSSELILASALYFSQEGLPLKRKISKAQVAKFRDCFPGLEDKQIQQLRQLHLTSGLLYGEELAQFSMAAFEKMWEAPYYQRLLALQAAVSQLSSTTFAKLLSIWPQQVLLHETQLHRLLSLIGLPPDQTGTCTQDMCSWAILFVQEQEQQNYYLLNPKIYESVLGTSQPHYGSNRLSSNWELYSDLRHPGPYIDLLLCARLEHFTDLSLFHIEKSRFQQYFNAENLKFGYFLQRIPQFEQCGLHISDLIQQQWRDWFNDSTRFQLFKDCLLVCQASYNELICRLLDEEGHILSNPQPGVFYLNEDQKSIWQNKLDSAGIRISKPFSSQYLADKTSTSVLHSSSLAFPLDKVILPQYMPPNAVLEKQASRPTLPLDNASFPWENWPTTPLSFVESRQLIRRNSSVSQLHIHFREARGLDYTAKRNLLHSLLTARNHMAIITVAEGDDFDLVSYIILPLSLEGPKENPSLLALGLQQKCLVKFYVKNITRVNEVFYSLINVSLLSLLPSDYVYTLEAQFADEQSALGLSNF